MCAAWCPLSFSLKLRGEFGLIQRDILESGQSAKAQPLGGLVCPFSLFFRRVSGASCSPGPWGPPRFIGPPKFLDGAFGRKHYTYQERLHGPGNNPRTSKQFRIRVCKRSLSREESLARTPLGRCAEAFVCNKAMTKAVAVSIGTVNEG